jgi:protein-S-isoprenylcysteine O-methyltransferase Ste14
LHSEPILGRVRVQKAFRQSKLYDALAAVPLIALYIFGASGLAMQVFAAARQAVTARSWLHGLDAAGLLLALVFIALQVVLFLVRRQPVLFSQGWLARGTAILAANFIAVLLLLPRAMMPTSLHALSAVLIGAGTAGSIYSASYLGRAFSILPQARQLVTSGPYRFIRHPLYLSEFVALFGVMLQFRQPWSLTIALAAIALQIPRMTFEERVLSAAFPTYRDYMARTARLMPHIY